MTETLSERGADYSGSIPLTGQVLWNVWNLSGRPADFWSERGWDVFADSINAVCHAPSLEAAILRAVESLHRERWPNEGPTYDPANDPECRPIIEQAVRAALSSQSGVLANGTWFRLCWPAGRIGKWHRASAPRLNLSERFCRCGRSVSGYGRRYSMGIVTETSVDLPPIADRCNAWRKAVR